MKRICAIGHFGKGKNLLNGQTIKTKIFTDQLALNYGEDEIVRIDTHGGIKAIPRLIIKVLWGICRCKNVVIFPSDNGLKVIVPLIAIYNIVFQRSLHYIVIGGYLHEYIKARSLIKRLLKAYSGIYVEAEPMKVVLDSFGFTNVSVVPNCKEIPILSKDELCDIERTTFNFCTFSRVMKSKGIEDAIYAIESINRKVGKSLCTLTIYGQVDGQELDWFEKIKAHIDVVDGINYGGFVPFDQSVSVLKKYYGLLFPTYYEGEGFAGTLIDAFAAGVPVIATNWHYNSSIIVHKQTGLIYPVEEKQKLQECIEYAIKNQNDWNQLRFNCIDKAIELAPSNVIKLITCKME